jgi:hypothetical protein
MAAKTVAMAKWGRLQTRLAIQAILPMLRAGTVAMAETAEMVLSA